MQSSGGLTSAHLFRGKDAILSGPAGGVVGAVETAALAGFAKIIGFDMGGTSTDVCHYDGIYERSFESVVAGVRVRAPMMLIHTVAAGGGSIIHYDGARFRVGPDSAGADPGPLSYRRGGPLTVTDANVMTGKLIPDFFPRIFGPGHDQPLDRDAVRKGFKALARKLGDGKTPEEVAEGCIRIAVENMANAIKTISVQRGYDVTEYVLNAFGGAGGQHACLVADALGITSVLIHPLSGVLSAYGIGLASISAMRSKAVLVPLDEEGLAALASIRAPLDDEVRQELMRQGVAERVITVTAQAHLRYAGTDSAIPIPVASLAGMRALFEIAHQKRFGFISPGKEIEIEAVEVTAEGGGEHAKEAELKMSDAPPDVETPSAFFTHGAWHEAPVILRSELQAGHEHRGPCPHHRGSPDGRGRAGLAGRRRPRRTIYCSPASPSGQKRAPASMPIRCCSKCSTISSSRSPSRWATRCKTPRARSTSRSGSTSPAPFSMRAGGWSQTPRIFPSISARWTGASRRCCAKPHRSSRAMCGC